MSDDEKKKACVLDTLSFSLLDQPTLVKKLASMFINAEDKLKEGLGRRARNNWEVCERTVGPWLRTVYTPPRGVVATTVKEIIAEVERQTAIQKKRADLIAYREVINRKVKPDERRNRVASCLYKLLTKNHKNEWEPAQSTCSFITSYGEWLLAMSAGGYYRESYLFVRNRLTGRSSLVNLGQSNSLNTTGLYAMLYSMATEKTRAAMFQGVPVTVDFDALAFNVGGRVEPIKNKGIVAKSDGGTPVTLEIG